MRPQMRAEDVIAIRWERNRGAILKDIAKKYGLSMGYISHICIGDYYPNIGGPLSATPATKTRCIRGHEYTPENTAITSSGRRNCRRCKNDLDNARRKQKRANARGQK